MAGASMTAVRETVDIRAEHEEHTMTDGIWIRLRNYPVSVFVRHDEVSRALLNREASAPAHYTPDAWVSARNIAIGIKAGSFPLSADERRRRLRF